MKLLFPLEKVRREERVRQSNLMDSWNYSLLIRMQKKCNVGGSWTEDYCHFMNLFPTKGNESGNLL